MSTPAAPGQRWARLRQDTQSVLRRGAWYLVRSLGPDEAVLEVDNATVRVPRDSVDADKLPESWGYFYVVCPNCAARAPVGRPAGEKRCTRCEQSFAVAWDERYLRTS